MRQEIRFLWHFFNKSRIGLKRRDVRALHETVCGRISAALLNAVTRLVRLAVFHGA